ncbi:hypothetical protein NPIL_12081 [Nephila pilipes]|uniref:Uncharacterized protein n=1 Tax=Nephila pilipes TaxID=299642 RepID=A0A8X6URP3_NEPPI|nr:hypothetical protein NPIL_12081 [Nephila pilipes]
MPVLPTEDMKDIPYVTLIEVPQRFAIINIKYRKAVIGLILLGNDCRVCEDIQLSSTIGKVSLNFYVVSQQPIMMLC